MIRKVITMVKLADISQFEALSNSTQPIFAWNAGFKPWGKAAPADATQTQTTQTSQSAQNPNNNKKTANPLLTAYINILNNSIGGIEALVKKGNVNVAQSLLSTISGLEKQLAQFKQKVASQGETTQQPQSQGNYTVNPDYNENKTIFGTAPKQQSNIWVPGQ